MVERHHDVFPPDGSDEQWLEHCGRNGRVALSRNERIRYTPNERVAGIQHRGALLIVIGKVPHAELARNFVNTLPRIEAFLDDHKPPFIAKVYRASPTDIARDRAAKVSISLWYPR